MIGALCTAIGLSISSTVTHLEVLGFIYAVLPGKPSNWLRKASHGSLYGVWW